MGATNFVRAPLVVALLLVALAASVLITAYSFERASGLFPTIVGWVFLLLALAELVVQVRGSISNSYDKADSAEVAHAPAGERVIKETKGFAWLGFFLVLLYLVGFLLGTLVYVFAFLRLSGKRSLIRSLLVATAATGFIYLLFAVLLQYKLYPGLLFGA